MPKNVTEGSRNAKKAKSKEAKRNGKKREERTENNANEVMLKPLHKNNGTSSVSNHRADREAMLSNKHLEADEEHDISSIGTRKKRRRTNRCICVTVSGVLLLIFSGAVAILVLLFLMVGERPPKVYTDCGLVEGDFDSATKAFIFKGIPYAKPPHHVLRWQPPQPLRNDSCWSGVYRADKTPPQCAQKDPKTNIISGSEDCLYLNIYTPKIDPLKLAPVMVYIHGGYLQWGNATTKGYCPDENNAVKLQAVFVNIQYRLNAFGFLVTEKQEGSGNYGFLDQIMALKWIKKNIRKFGGNPDKITIFGQSSGGTSVFALMTSPLAKGLFHHAWMLSGSPVLDKPLAKAREENKFFLTKLNCSDEACLLRKSTEEVLNAMYPQWDVLDYSMNLPKRNQSEPALAIIDGTVLPVAPFDAWKYKRQDDYSDVPLVVGTTAQEIDLNPTPGDAIKQWTKDDLYKYVSSYLDTFEQPGLVNRSLELYGSSNRDAEYIFTTMATDIRVTCGNNRLAAKAAKALTSPVYRYVVTSFPSRSAHALNMDFDAKYAFHGWDIYAFLDSYGNIMSSKSESDNKFSSLLRENMISFAKMGSPKDKSWIGYPHKVALLSDRLTVSATYNDDKCELWNSDEFFSYSWMN